MIGDVGSDESGDRQHESLRAVSATMLVGVASMLILGIQPIVLGGLTAQGRLTEAGLGQAAMVEVFALAVGSAVGPFVMNSGRMRLQTGLAALVLAAVNGGMFLANTAAWVLVLRGAAGLVEGLMLGSVIVILTHSRQPERMNGLLLGITTAPQILAAYLLPAVIIPRLGLNAAFGMLGASAFCAALAAPLLVDRVRPPGPQVAASIPWSPALVALLLGALAQNAGIGAAWNYIERLGSQYGLPPALIGSVIAGSLFLQFAGALLSAWFSVRLPARAMLIAGAFLQSVVVTALAASGLPVVYGAATCLFGLFWLALQPFLVSELIALDASRRVALVMTPVALVGLSLGPLLVSFAVRAGDVRGGFLGAAGLLATGGLLYGFTALQSLRRRRRPVALKYT